MATPGLHGKERPFWRGLLLTIVTFGIYALYWHFKALDEVAKQWKKGEVSILWFILMIVVPLIPYIVYMVKFLGTVHATRKALGMDEGVSTAAFFLWYFVGMLIIVGPLVAYAKLQGAINECWRKAKAPAPPAAPRPTAARPM